MTLDINIAKALLAVIKTSDAPRELDRVQVETFLKGSSPFREESRHCNRRYVATNGHVLLVVEQVATGVDEGNWTYSLDDLKEYVSSKGYSPLTDRSDDYGSFPDWEQCMPSTTSPVETIGLAVQHLKMLADIGRFLKVGDNWKVSFDGQHGPTTWEPQGLDACPKNGDLVRVSFIIMPIRLD
jgi:hypothetical protein